jgi:hypothetical protein
MHAKTPVLMWLALKLCRLITPAKTWKDDAPPSPPSAQIAPIKDSPDERSLGATVIMGQLNAVITGVSIVLAGIGAFIALGKTQIVDPANFHLLYATVWAVVALGTALLTHGMLPVRTPDTNFVKDKSVAVLSSASLFFALAAGVRFVLAVRSILFGTSPPPS